MTPQLVDLNADGYNDMVMATYEGTAFLVQGSKDGFLEPKHILDEDGETVRISTYYDLDKSEYLHVDRSGDDEPNNKDHHMTSIAVVDWDEDGDLDLVLGATEGGLYLCKNKGDKHKPKFSKTNRQIMVEDRLMMKGVGLATPRIADFNGDGKFDILCGGSERHVFYFENIGEAGKPKFAASKTLVKGFSYLHEEGYETAIPVPQDSKGMPLCPGSDYYIDVVDYDKDGDLDLLTGARAYTMPEPKKLSAKERTERDRLKIRLDEIDAEMSKMFDDQSPEDVDKIYESEQFRKLSESAEKLFERYNELVTSPQMGWYVWVYRNKAITAK